MDASGSSSGAHATTWPHAQMTSSNIAEVGTNWFRQLRALMNNYLDGSSNHVFGYHTGRMATGPWTFGPHHGPQRFESPTAVATKLVQEDLTSRINNTQHADHEIASKINPDDFNFDGFGLDPETKSWLQTRGTIYMGKYIKMYRDLRSADLVIKHNSNSTDPDDSITAWARPNVLQTYWQKTINRAKNYITTGVSPELLMQAQQALQDQPDAFSCLEIDRQ